MKNNIHLYEASYWVSPIPSTGCSRVRSPDSFTEQNVFDFTHLTFSRWNLISKTSFTMTGTKEEYKNFLIGITPIYKRHLWSEEVNVINDKQ